VAAGSIEAGEEVVNISTQAVVDVLSNRMPTYIVNPAVREQLRTNESERLRR